jgi:mannosyltransferase
MKALKNADGIICISKNTKKDMLELYPELREKNIKVIYNGFSSNDYVYDENIPFENLALFVGARKGYKNFDKAVEVVAATEDLKLIIVGAALDRLEKELLDRTLPKRYHLFTHVSNEKLNELYNKSICLLYLSEYEGFGIPVLEAMSAGCPIVALKKSSIPEVAGDAGILFSNFDKNALQKTIELLRDNKELRTKQIELGLNNAKRFSWDKCYKEVLDFYNEVI